MGSEKGQWHGVQLIKDAPWQLSEHYGQAGIDPDRARVYL
jgi:hypothetical protein